MTYLRLGMLCLSASFLTVMYSDDSRSVAGKSVISGLMGMVVVTAYLIGMRHEREEGGMTPSDTPSDT
jgi:hypothetical protein